MKKFHWNPTVRNKKPTLVTVTCTRDKWFAQLQLHSIDKFFISGVNHIVIIEDDVTPMNEWIDLLVPHYKQNLKHNLTIVSKETLPNIYPNLRDQCTGWHRQQLLKFNISQYIDDESYTVLDSKDIFVKKIDADQLPKEGNGVRINIKSYKKDSNYFQWISYLSEKLCMNIPKYFWWVGTPFTLDTESVKKIIETLDLESLYNDIDHNQSEFLLYRFFRNIKIDEGTFSHSFCGYQNIQSIDQLQENYQYSSIFQLHRTALTDEHGILTMIQFLTELGMNSEYVEKALRIKF